MIVVILTEVWMNSPTWKIKTADKFGRGTFTDLDTSEMSDRQHANAMRNHLETHFADKSYFCIGAGETEKGYAYVMQEQGT
mgnify:CR=1 FL=1